MSFLHKTMTNEEISQIRYLKRVRRQFQCLHLQLRISPFSLVGARRASKKLKIFHAAAIKSERFNDQFIKWQRNKFAIINCKVNTTREPFNNGERFLWASVQSWSVSACDNGIVGLHNWEAWRSCENLDDCLWLLRRRAFLHFNWMVFKIMENGL